MKLISGNKNFVKEIIELDDFSRGKPCTNTLLKLVEYKWGTGVGYESFETFLKNLPKDQLINLYITYYKDCKCK